MKKVMIIKRCHFKPNGSGDKIFARPGQVVVVSSEDAERMVAGHVAETVKDPTPKKAPVNRQKKVDSVK